MTDHSPQPPEEAPPAEGPGLTLRMEIEGLKIVATSGNGRFIIGQKYNYVPEARLRSAEQKAYEESCAAERECCDLQYRGDDALKALTTALADCENWRENAMGAEKVLIAAQAENKRLRWQLQQFKVHGTDGCSACETGRVTLFIANQKCIHCDPKGYEIPAALSASAGGGEK